LKAEVIKILKHQVEINVLDIKGNKSKVLKGGEVKIRDKLLNFLLGKQQNFLILVPSETVESVSIREVVKGE